MNAKLSVVAYIDYPTPVVRFIDTNIAVKGPSVYFFNLKGEMFPFDRYNIPAVLQADKYSSLELFISTSSGCNSVSLSDRITANLLDYLYKEEQFTLGFMCHDFVNYLFGVYSHDNSTTNAIHNNWRKTKQGVTCDDLAVGTCCRFTGTSSGLIYHSAIYLGRGLFLSKCATGSLIITDLNNSLLMINEPDTVLCSYTLANSQQSDVKVEEKA